jgi:uncharacterized protein
MEITVRKPAFAFNGFPRHWMGGNPLATHLANGLHLVFPLGERFFVRSVRAYLDRIKDDPELLQQVKGFIGQEVRHGMEHERFFETLEANGYDTKTFLRLFEKIAFGIIEPAAPRKLRLSVTVALEHFTASFANKALTSRLLEDLAPPAMRDLLLWHASEEIEHKAVAFDVLKKVDPRYSVRIAGLIVATITLTGFWMMGTAMLMRQEKGVSMATLRRDWRKLAPNKPIGPATIAAAFREYLRPDFHPSQKDDYHLARDYFAEMARAAAA